MLLDGIRDEFCPSFMNGGDGGHVLDKLLVRGIGFDNFSTKRDWGKNREQADGNILWGTHPYRICEELRREGNFRTNLGRDLVKVLDFACANPTLAPSILMKAGSLFLSFKLPIMAEREPLGAMIGIGL
jgi:hypothetical protein